MTHNHSNRTLAKQTQSKKRTVAIALTALTISLSLTQGLLQAQSVYQSRGWLKIDGDGQSSIYVRREGGDISVFKRVGVLESRIARVDKDGVIGIYFNGTDQADYFENETDFRARAFGFDGNDVLVSNGPADFDGGNGNDRLFGGKKKDTLRGGPGNDSLYGYENDDGLMGGPGHDYLSGGKGNDYLAASPGMIFDGHNSLYGGDGDDVLIGGLGHDALFGGRNNDRMYGLDGDDLMVGEHGQDLMLGGEGQDLVDGGDGHDWIEGGNGNDSLYGGDGSDIMDGGFGLDTLFGGDNNDILYGGQDLNDRDVIQGNDGNDTFVTYHPKSMEFYWGSIQPTNDRIVDRVENESSSAIFDGLFDLIAGRYY